VKYYHFVCDEKKKTDRKLTLPSIDNDGCFVYEVAMKMSVHAIKRLKGNKTDVIKLPLS
jgi:hypothetical protein